MVLTHCLSSVGDLLHVRGLLLQSIYVRENSVARREIRKKIASINQWEEAPDRKSDRQKKEGHMYKQIHSRLHAHICIYICL